MQISDNLSTLIENGYSIEEIRCQKYENDTLIKDISFNSIHELKNMIEDGYTKISITLKNDKEKILYIYDSNSNLLFVSDPLEIGGRVL